MTESTKPSNFRDRPSIPGKRRPISKSVVSRLSLPPEITEKIANASFQKLRKVHIYQLACLAISFASLYIASMFEAQINSYINQGLLENLQCFLFAKWYFDNQTKCEETLNSTSQQFKIKDIH